ncbi:FkbM family methyltransferase [Brevibacillus sp. B_LB10_24]|uniref:FkbM family methyltransferase n=1 Tax=Brevibacillus sp. B_LB10_24 TaxID=3380645 RepID=UPI0038B8E038
MHDLYSLCQEHGIASRGVIHVGSHEGQEVPLYQMMGMQNILLVEANPDVYQRLHSNISSFPNVKTANCAICNYNGFARFHVTTSDFCSSILPLKTVTANYPGIVETHEISVPARTLDTLLGEMQLSPQNYNFLNIDIQGAELLAFQGAVGLLQHVEAVNTEVNFEELYEGCAMIDQIDQFLSVFGFHRVATTQYHPTWGDALYVKRR